MGNDVKLPRAIVCPHPAYCMVLFCSRVLAPLPCQ